MRPAAQANRELIPVGQDPLQVANGLLASAEERRQVDLHEAAKVRGQAWFTLDGRIKLAQRRAHLARTSKERRRGGHACLEEAIEREEEGLVRMLAAQVSEVGEGVLIAVGSQELADEGDDGWLGRERPANGVLERFELDGGEGDG